jgi:hypothetical protein
MCGRSATKNPTAMIGTMATTWITKRMGHDAVQAGTASGGERGVMKRTITDPDLIAIADIRKALFRLRSWEMKVRVLFYLLREVWPNAYNSLMDVELFRQKS